jgi:hypothetical protein
MGLQLQDLPMKLSGVTYSVVGIAAAIVIIARLTRGPNVSKMNKTTYVLPPLSFTYFSSLIHCLRLDPVACLAPGGLVSSS